jgi:hypothetical protein
MADSEGIAVPNPLLDHESGLRRLMADAAGEPYVAYTSLAEASADPHGAVILEGDDGGQIYVACPASSVRCSEEDLQRLLNDIDAFAWNDPDAAAVRYERRPGGSGIAGGMGGARVMAGVWVHEELQQLGLEAAIGEVLAGERQYLRTSDASLTKGRRRRKARHVLRSFRLHARAFRALSNAVRR